MTQVWRQIDLNQSSSTELIHSLNHDHFFNGLFCWRAKDSQVITIALGEHPNGDANLEDDFFYYSIKSFENSDKDQKIAVPYIVINLIENQAHIINQEAPDEVLQECYKRLKNFADKSISKKTINKLKTSELVDNRLQLENWEQSFNKAKNLIETNEVEKFVLSRTRSLGHKEKTINDLLFWSPIQDGLFRYEQYFILYMPTKDKIHFSMTPETLIIREGQTFRIDALAGTRKVSDSPQENKHIQKELMNNKKERREHAIVEEFVSDVLNLHNLTWKRSKDVSIKKLRFVQHLYSQFTVKARKEELPNLIKQLHPTPAVGTRPYFYWKEIKSIEKRDRGLYAGLIGWHSKDTDNIAVNLRCIDIEEDKMHIHAGCGIIAQSEMRHEFIETERKMFNYTQFLEINEENNFERELEK